MSFGPSVRNGVALGLGSIPSLQNAPPYASLNLRFNETTTLDPRITFTRASTGTYVDSAGVLQTAASNAPRFDYNPTTLAPLGFLIESSRTNSIRNNTMVGAVAGTPGTVPTNWTSIGSGLGTLTQTIVGTGTQNGIEYIDIRYFGTASTASYGAQFETGTQVVAAPAQVWTSSLWFGIVGGSTAGINTITQAIVERNLSGAYLTQIGIDLKSSGSTMTRSSFVGTLGNALTARVVSAVIFGFAIGAAIDITFRIGLPQLELGFGVSSAIKTTTTALTRAADSPLMTGTNFSDWFNPVEGTFVVSYDAFNIATGAFPVILAASDYTVANRIQISYNQTSRRAVVTVGGSNTFDVNLGTGVNGMIDKSAIAYKADDFAACVNGGVVATDNAGAVPVVDRLVLGNYLSGGSIVNGHLRSVAYYPRRLSNGELQALTV